MGVNNNNSANGLYSQAGTATAPLVTSALDRHFLRYVNIDKPKCDSTPMQLNDVEQHVDPKSDSGEYFNQFTLEKHAFVGLDNPVK